MINPKYVLVQESRMGDILQIHNAIKCLEANNALICRPEEITFCVREENGHLFEAGGIMSCYGVYLIGNEPKTKPHMADGRDPLYDVLFPNAKIIYCQAKNNDPMWLTSFKNYHAGQIYSIYEHLSTKPEIPVLRDFLEIPNNWIILNLSGFSSVLSKDAIAKIGGMVRKIADSLKVRVLDISEVRLSKYSDLAQWIEDKTGTGSGRKLFVTNNTGTYHDLSIGDARVLIQYDKTYSHSVEYVDCIGSFFSGELASALGQANFKSLVNNFFNWQKNVTLFDNKHLYGLQMFADISSTMVFHTYSVFDEKDLMTKRRHAVTQMAYSVLPENDIYYKQFVQRKKDDAFFTVGEMFLNGLQSAVSMGGKPKDILMFTNTDVGLVPEALYFIRRGVEKNGGAVYASRVDVLVNKCLTYADIMEAQAYVGTDMFAFTLGFLQEFLDNPEFLPYFEMYLGNHAWDFVMRKMVELFLFKTDPKLNTQFGKLQENVCYHQTHPTSWHKESAELEVNNTLLRSFCLKFGFEHYLVSVASSPYIMPVPDAW